MSHFVLTCPYCGKTLVRKRRHSFRFYCSKTGRHFTWSDAA